MNIENIKNAIGNIAPDSSNKEIVESLTHVVNAIKDVDAQILENEQKAEEKLEIIVDSLTALLDSVGIISSQFKVIAHLQGDLDISESKKVQDQVMKLVTQLD